MIKYLGAAATLAAAYGIEGALEVMVVAYATLACIFYAMAFRLFAGLSQAMITGTFDVLHMTTVYMIYVTMTALTLNSQYDYIAFMAMPWIAIQTVINILSVLIKLDIVGINHK